MPKPYNVYDPMTGALRRPPGAPRPNRVRFANRPMTTETLAKSIDVSERRARAIVSGRAPIRGTRIA